MKRSALAFVIAVGAPQDFRAEFLRIGAAGEQMAMIPVRGEKIIVRSERRERGNSGGFLADVKMIMSAENSFVVERNQTLFEVANDEHPAAKIQQGVSGYFGQHDDF